MWYIILFEGFKGVCLCYSIYLVISGFYGPGKTFCDVVLSQEERLR